MTWCGCSLHTISCHVAALSN